MFDQQKPVYGCSPIVQLLRCSTDGSFETVKILYKSEVPHYNHSVLLSTKLWDFRERSFIRTTFKWWSARIIPYDDLGIIFVPGWTRCPYTTERWHAGLLSWWKNVSVVEFNGDSWCTMEIPMQNRLTTVKSLQSSWIETSSQKTSQTCFTYLLYHAANITKLLLCFKRTLSVVSRTIIVD